MTSHPAAPHNALVGGSVEAASKAAPSSARRPQADDKRHSEDTPSPSSKTRTGMSFYADVWKEETAGGEDGEDMSLALREARQPGGQGKALSPCKLYGPLATVGTFDPDTLETEDGSGRRWLTQQQAAEEFCLSAQTLRDAANEGLLQVEKRPNPYGATYAPMRLYQRCELRRLAFRMWGDETGLEKERERRREQRWQHRQRQASGVLCGSVPPTADSTWARGKAGKSLPDLRVFLQSSSKRKRERKQHNVNDASLRACAEESVGTNSARKRSTNRRQRGRRAAASAQCCATEDVSAISSTFQGGEAVSRSLETSVRIPPGEQHGLVHSDDSRADEWEEI